MNPDVMQEIVVFLSGFAGLVLKHMKADFKQKVSCFIGLMQKTRKQMSYQKLKCTRKTQ